MGVSAKPKDITSLRGFLGLMGYYRPIMKGYDV